MGKPAAKKSRKPSSKSRSKRGKTPSDTTSDTESFDTWEETDDDSKAEDVEVISIASSPATSVESERHSNSKASERHSKASTKASKRSVRGSVKEEEDFFKDVPDLIAELKENRDGSKIKYVTQDVRHRQFELKARKDLLQLHNDYDIIKETFKSSLQITRNLCPESKSGSLAELVKTLGFPKSFKELVEKLVIASEPGAGSGPGAETSVQGTEQQQAPFEDSESELQTEINKLVVSTPYGAKAPKPVFPSPGKMVNKFKTPKQDHHGGVFHFGQSHQKGVMSTSKAPRAAKPGEVMYSESGSPIYLRKIPDDFNFTSKNAERVEIIQPDGSKIEVDMVYRGGNNPDKLRGFKEFAKDVRGVAASRSTTVKRNRIQPARIKAGPQSAQKKKPEWR